MSFTIRPLDLPSDYGPLAELLTAIQGAPISPEALVDEDRQIPAVSNLARKESGELTGFGRARFLATTPDGHPIGYAVSWRAPWTPPGAVCSLFGVDPAHRRRGVGTALVQALESWARSIGADLLMGELPDHPAGTEIFISRIALRIDAHVQQYVLPLADWRPTDSPTVLEGLRYFTLAEAPQAETEARLYELYCATLVDNPGHVGALPPFAVWQKDALPADRTTPELVFLATDGDRLVGVSALFRTDDPSAFYTDYTGVDRAYRGKGIARTLKERSFRAAQALGARQMITETEASNVSMRSLNLRMGYQVQSGSYRIIKRLD